MIVCLPVTVEGQIDPRWGRANRVAVADVRDGAVLDWREDEVQWGELHDAGTEGSHHARVARFLLDHHVETVAADHMGQDMHRMLQKMGLAVRLGAAGDARAAAIAAAG
jgi:predicted Fe-Mo cluster-binding NifX family protein